MYCKIMVKGWIMNSIEKYIATATFNLPDQERNETAKELREFINSSISVMDKTLSEDEKIKKILTELGDPSSFISKYYRKKRSLIGPRYFYKYIFVLKLVLLAIFIAITVEILISHFFQLKTTIATFIIEYLTNLLSGLSQGFVFVTLIFSLLEYKGVELTLKYSDGESINVSRIGPKKNIIKKSSCYIELTFTFIFFVIIYFYPKYIGAYINSGNGISAIPLFDLLTLEALGSTLILIFSVQIIQNILKLAAKELTLLSSLFYSLLTVVSSGLIITMLMTPDLFNKDFFTYISNLINIPNLINLHTSFINILVIIIILASIIDITETLYKSLKYGT